MVLAAAFAGFAAPAGAAGEGADLHALMVKNLGDACRVDRERLARFEPRMIVVHALVDQTTLRSGWARAKVIKPVLGGMDRGMLLPMVNRHRGIGGAPGAHLVEGKQYLISMFRYRNVLVVDRALECQGA